MKQALCIIAAGMLFACSNTDKNTTGSNTAVAGTAIDKTAALNDSANYTQIQWMDSTMQDLGKLQDGQVVDIAWRFKNVGTKPLIVAQVQAGCGCTVAEKPEQPIAPGGEGIIRAKYNSKGQSMGTQRKTVTATVNTAQQTYPLEFMVNIIKN